MKVLHIIDHMGLGGEQRVVQDLALMRGPDVFVEVWSLRDHQLPRVAERLDEAGVPYRTMGFSGTAFVAAIRLRRQLQALRPDIVHVHLEYSTLVGALAVQSLPPPWPILVASVANDPYRQAPFHRLAGRRLATAFGAHITHSQGIEDAVRQAYGGRPHRLECVNLGIDLRRCDRSRAVPARVAEHRRGAGCVVGSMGRLVPQKAMHVLLDAAPALLRANPDTRVLIVGDGPLRRALEEQARRLGIAEAVTFTGYEEDVASAYAAMDVFVLPSRDEGFGLVFLEAMAMGVPVVGTRVIGSEDAVDDGVTGLLVPYNDPSALALAVRRLVEEPGLAARLRRTAGERVRRLYSRDRFAAEVETIYRELIEAATPARLLTPATFGV